MGPIFAGRGEDRLGANPFLKPNYPPKSDSYHILQSIKRRGTGTRKILLSFLTLFLHRLGYTERKRESSRSVWRELLMAAARSALLNHLRVHIQAVPRNPSYTLSFNSIRRRFLSEEVRGSFLDKSEVADRVISVVKNFQKVDPSKVKSATSKINTCNNLLLSDFQCFDLLLPRLQLLLTR